LYGPLYSAPQKFHKVLFERTFGSLLQKGQLEKQELVAVRFLRFLYTEHGRTGIQILLDFKTDDSLPIDDRQNDAVKGYFSDALHLFIGASSSYDPLMKDYSTFASMPTSKTEEEKTLEEHFKAAQRAVKQDTWMSQGIGNSM
jgi:hypothetical protein